MRSPLAPSRIALLAAVLAACDTPSLTAPASRSKLVACSIVTASSTPVADTIWYDLAIPFEPVASDVRAEEARADCSTRVSPFIGQPGRRTDVESAPMTRR